tara:strand:+ start:235 stop:762 length:528 start_codon:yes stop_codon:yes gene_type:complete
VPPRNGKKIAAGLRRSRVIQLKVAGATEARIAEIEGVSPSQVFKDVKRYLKDLAARDEGAANEVRVLQMERYSRLLTSWWAKAIGGDVEAAGIALRILTRMDVISGIVPDKPLVNLVDASQSVNIAAQEHRNLLITPEVAAEAAKALLESGIDVRRLMLPPGGSGSVNGAQEGDG